ncbi:hypothetical protein [Bacillus sp. 2205SS5-2]|uniref:hypothetical protein n=1 Tax=Bacillus sp. 2205SS5-2 TaxID=3109031 RepID=UPI003006148B
MGNPLSQEQIDNIQIDYAIVFANYGEVDQEKIGPTKGGAEFSATKNIYDIEYDGKMGKTKGMQNVDEINASLKFSVLDTQLKTLEMVLASQAEFDEGTGKISNNQGGIIDSSKYLKNLTMFAKTVNGKFKKITLFNAMNESDFVLGAKPKVEGEIPIEVFAHHDPIVMGDIYDIQDVDAIA